MFEQLGANGEIFPTHFTAYLNIKQPYFTYKDKLDSKNP